MDKNDYITSFSPRWWLLWAAVTCMIYAVANFVQNIPEEWKFVITVAAPFVVGFFLLIANPVWRWCKMHDPIKVTYLIPKEKYREVSYPGAGSDEKTPNELTVGIGYYRVMHLIIPKREIDIKAIKLHFRGPNKNKPKPRGEDNPYWVDEINRYSGQPSPDQYLNWEGEVYPFPLTDGVAIASN